MARFVWLIRSLLVAIVAIGAMAASASSATGAMPSKGMAPVFASVVAVGVPHADDDAPLSDAPAGGLADADEDDDDSADADLAISSNLPVIEAATATHALLDAPLASFSFLERDIAPRPPRV